MKHLPLSVTPPIVRHTTSNAGIASSPRFSIRQKLVHPVHSVIHVAADCNKGSVVPFLFNNRAHIKVKEVHGCMTLHQTSYLDFIDTARLLVQRNANAVFVCCSNGRPYQVVTYGTKELFSIITTPFDK